MSKKASRCLTQRCSLGIQVEDRAADADSAVKEAEKTNKRATDLDSEVEKLRKKIQGEGNHHCSVGFRFDHQAECVVVLSKTCCRSRKSPAPRCPAKTWRSCSGMLSGW